MLRAATTPWVIVLCLVIVAFGCGRKPQKPVAVAPVEEVPSEPVEDPKVVQKRKMEERVTQGLDRLKLHVAKQPQEFAENIALYEKLLDDARGLNAEKKVQERVDSLKKEFAAHAQKQLEALYPDIERLVKEQDFRQAEVVLAKWDSETFADQPSFAEWTRKKTELATMAEAEDAARNASSYAEKLAAQLDYAKAVADLEAYPDRFQGTKFHDEIQVQLASVYELYKGAKAEKVKVEEIGWNNVEINDHLSGFSPRAKEGADVWAGSGGVLKAENKTDSESWLIAGEDDWIEYYLDFEVKLGDSQNELRVGTRKMQGPGVKGENFYPNNIPLAGGEWHRVRITVEAAKAKAFVDEEEVLENRIEWKYPSGGYVFVLKPGEQIEIKSFRYKVIKTEAKEKKKKKSGKGKGDKSGGKDDDDGKGDDSDKDDGGKDEGGKDDKGG